MDLRPLAFAVLTLTAHSALAGITLYEAENFGGRRTTVNGAVPNFVAQGFRDQAGSAVVEGASVEVCIDINFGGGCTVLKPGRYSQLRSAGDRISSVRPVGGPRAAAEPLVLAAPGGPGGAGAVDPGPTGRRAGATLYGRPNFQGRAIALNREGASDLEQFNERASSLVVERGYWIFCSEPEFRGQCRTFGPGRYPTLPPNLDNRISSGRRISNAYPYSQGPTWDRDR